MHPFKRVRVNPLTPEPEVIARAAGIIRQGGVIVFPTRNLYGLAADPFNPQAVGRIFHIKKRPLSKPILILIEDRRQLNGLVRKVPAPAVCLMDRFWPGRLTLVLPAADTVPEILTGGSGCIGIRLPEHPVSGALVRAVGTPVTGTSANLSGEVGCSNSAYLDDVVSGQVDLILDAGPLKEGIGSTVLEVSRQSVSVLREGAVSIQELRSVLDAHNFKRIDKRE